LYLTYYRFAVSICLRFSRSADEAREIVNDGFFKIMTNLDKYVHGQSFKGWLRKIMVNSAIDYYRRNEKHYHNVDISYVKNESLTPEILNQFNEEFILKAIQELPPSYRLVFNLYVVEGYKHDEIGQILGITAGTSRSNLNIARCKLMKALSPQYQQKTNEHE
jgi:RNA polymerase sigma factor (sigma-70 family)